MAMTGQSLATDCLPRSHQTITNPVCLSDDVGSHSPIPGESSAIPKLITAADSPRRADNSKTTPFRGTQESLGRSRMNTRLTADPGVDDFVMDRAFFRPN